MNKSIEKSDKGITLIALVITIIILLILAAITIESLKENGLFENAKAAKQKYKNAQDEENEILKEYELEIDGNNVTYNDFKKWMSYVNLDNKYNSISELFENKDDIDKVINNKDCVNYMIKSTGELMNEIVSNEQAVKAIGTNNYTAAKVIENNDWFKAIQNSEFANSFDEGSTKIPELLSNTSNGIATGSSSHTSSYDYYHAFTGKQPNNTTGANIWRPLPDGNPSWISYEFEEEEEINIYKLEFNTFAEPSGPSRWAFPTKYVLQCKINDGDDNDNSNWVECSPIFEMEDISSKGQLLTDINEKDRWWKVVDYFKSNIYGKKFRLYIYETAPIGVNINRLQIYGKTK